MDAPDELALAPPTEPTGQVATIANHRLHPATLWVPCCELLTGLIIPAAIASLWVGPGLLLWLGGWFVVLPAALYHVAQYFTLEYRFSRTELTIRSGLLFRRERQIPFERIQEINMHQGLVHRFLDLARIQISTAGGDAKEANLNVLSCADAEELRAAIDQFQHATESLLKAKEADYECFVSLRELVVGGLTSQIVASIGALIGAIIYFQVFYKIGAGWFNKIEQHASRHMPSQRITELIEGRIPDTGPAAYVSHLIFDETLGKSIALVIFGLGATVVTYVIRFYGFRLTRRGELLSSQYGLLTVKRGSLSRERIQTMKLEEGLLRRWFGLASVRVDSAGDNTQVDDQKKRDVLVPVAKRELALEAAVESMPGIANLQPDWNRVSPRAIMRGSRKGWLLLLLVMAQTYAFAGWFCLAWLPAFPLMYLLNRQWFLHTGYAIESDHFLSRKGWINRSTTCLPIRNIQNVSVYQSFFDRRAKLASLSIDTAGQSNTGGGPVIRHLPVADAFAIQGQLSTRAEDFEFGW